MPFGSSCLGAEAFSAVGGVVAFGEPSAIGGAALTGADCSLTNGLV